MIAAAIYARKSTEQTRVTEEQKSVTRQVEHGRAYAAAQGWTVADEHVFEDDGISGAEFVKRPGFLRLMNALKPRPTFQILIMSDLDRLGRESIQTPYAVQQLLDAGVKIYTYLDKREITMGSPIDTFLVQVQAFVASLEREKARQRTYDAMLRKAKAGHVTGGSVFGFDNVEKFDVVGKRSHVERVVNEQQAAVIRRIYELCAAGHGCKTIAKTLNGDGVSIDTPRPQQGRPSAWAPSSVREVLFRPLYRGQIVWNRTQKRDSSGRKRQHARPDADRIIIDAPQLRIVTEELWQAAHERLDTGRAIYSGAALAAARPADGRALKYLLSGNARCGLCGGSFVVRSRNHGAKRAFYYACSSYYHKGKTVCPNSLETPMLSADNAVLAELKNLLRPHLIEAIIARTVAHRCAPRRDHESKRTALALVIANAEAEQEQLVAAVTAGGGDVPALVAALRDRQGRLVQLRRDLDALSTAPVAPISSREQEALIQKVRHRLVDWQGLLMANTTEARCILARLLKGRLTFTPRAEGRRRFYEFTGSGTIQPILEGIVDESITRYGVPNFHQLEPDVELAKPAPEAPTSRIVKRGRSWRITSS